MKDFIHKTLINAGGKDAVSNMLSGAAMGAGANTALGAIQGDFDIIGNATSGALLGAGGGAALRHAGDKYTSGIAALQKTGKVPETFSNNIFTHAIKEEADFMGNPEMMKRAQDMAGNITSSKGATTSSPKAAQPSSSGNSMADSFKGKEGHLVDGEDVYKATGKTKEVSMPGFTTFDAFGNPKTTGGTFDMNMHRKMSETEQKTSQRADEIRATQKTERNTQAAKNPVQMNSNTDSSYKPKNVKDLTGATTNQKIADAEAARRMAQAQGRNTTSPTPDKSKSPVTQAQKDQLKAKKTADSVANQRAEEANNRFMSRSDSTPFSGNPVTNSQKDLLKSIKESGLSIKDYNAQQASKNTSKNKKGKK